MMGQKSRFYTSINRAFYTKTLITLQRQAVIKLIEKKDNGKRYIKKQEIHFFVKC